MAIDTLTLPKDPKALAHILRAHADRCEQSFMHRRTNWLLAWYYLQGYRRFDIYDPTTGSLTPHMLDGEGNAEFQSQELLHHINQVSGRIQAMDLRPKVDQQGFTLGGQRNKALSQILCDSIFSEQEIARVKEEWAFMYTCLGFAGITGHIVDHPTIGLTADLECIHPKELFPFPLVSQDISKVRGLMRQRWVPLDFLKKVYGKKIAANMEDLDWYEIEPGEPFEHQDENQHITYMPNKSGANTTSSAETQKKLTAVVKVRELWLSGPRGTVTRYVVTSGDYVLDDQDLEGTEVYCPIGYARFFNNGTFHGAGMFDLMFSVHRKFEQLSKSLYNNIMDIDRYGILVMPQGQFNQNNLLKDVGRGLRVMFWDPDPVAEGFNPFPIQPFNSGDMPGKVAEFAKRAMSDVNPIRDLIQEKGRVDSASGLQFLDEQISRALTSPTLGVQSAWGQMYRATTQKALTKLTVTRKAIPVGSLSLEMAGAIIDPESNQISFSTNPLPDISRLSFNIREVSPRSVVARKQEAIQLWQMGIQQDPMAFRLFALKEDIDFAMWMDEDRGAYEMGIRAILMVYNDGQASGPLILTPHTTRPEIVMRLLTSFMCGPAMQVASPGVFNAFKLFRSTLISYMGLTLPAAVPNPDDAALLSQLQPGMMGGSQMALPPGQSQQPSF